MTTGEWVLAGVTTVGILVAAVIGILQLRKRAQARQQANRTGADVVQTDEASQAQVVKDSPGAKVAGRDIIEGGPPSEPRLMVEPTLVPQWGPDERRPRTLVILGVRIKNVGNAPTTVDLAELEWAKASAAGHSWCAFSGHFHLVRPTGRTVLRTRWGC